MTWAMRRGLRLLVATLLALAATLAAAIVAVSMLSVRDRITLAGGIAVFALAVVVWMVATSALAVRWRRWARSAESADTEGRVLVAYGSRHGATAGIATIVGEALESVGIVADVRPARTIARLNGYRAVIVGGALYAGRWHADARRFVRRHAPQLCALPVWLFASGPLGTEEAAKDLPPVRHVAAAAAQVGALGTVTFGGRLAEDATGVIARKLVEQGRAGDFRDPDRIRAWTESVATELARLHDGGQAPTGVVTR